MNRPNRPDVREVVIVKMDHPSVKRLQRFFPVDLMHAEEVRS